MGGGLEMGRAYIEPSKPSSSSPSSAVTTSTSTSITETVNGEHDFRFSGYSLAKGSGIGKYIASDTFTVGGYSWAIYFYPDGKSTEDNASYVSLFIALASDGFDVRALFELTLIDQSGNERHKVHSHFGRALKSGPYTLKYRGSMWGYKRFFKRSALETSDYLKDDCLQVHCRVGVVKSHTEGPKSYSIHIPPSDKVTTAERVRREKINERMKFLQDLVPGCNKVTGKVAVLDEIINYVQSLQRQVEFSSMKLATINPR